MTEEKRDIDVLRKRLHLKAFYMMFEMAAVIAVPALIVVGISNFFELVRGITILLLVLTFILSWVIIIIRVRTLRVALKELDDQFVAEKQK